MIDEVVNEVEEKEDERETYRRDRKERRRRDFESDLKYKMSLALMIDEFRKHMSFDVARWTGQKLIECSFRAMPKTWTDDYLFSTFLNDGMRHLVKSPSMLIQTFIEVPDIRCSLEHQEDRYVFEFIRRLTMTLVRTEPEYVTKDIAMFLLRLRVSLMGPPSTDGWTFPSQRIEKLTPFEMLHLDILAGAEFLVVEIEYDERTRLFVESLKEIKGFRVKQITDTPKCVSETSWVLLITWSPRYDVDADFFFLERDVRARRWTKYWCLS